MKKFISLMIFFFIFSTLFSQNLEFKKTLTNPYGLTIEAPYGISPIQYYKCGDHILRQTSRYFQYYDSELNLIWEFVLPRLEKSKRTNIMRAAGDDNSVYIVQFVQGYEPELFEMKLHRIDLVGNVKTIDISDLSFSFGIYGLNVLDNRLVISASEMYFDKKAGRIQSKNIGNLYHMVFDSTLNRISPKTPLKPYNADSSHFVVWKYYGSTDSTCIYGTRYFLDTGGSTEIVSQTMYKEIIQVNAKNEIVLSVSGLVTPGEKYFRYQSWPYKCDSAIYKVYINDMEVLEQRAIDSDTSRITSIEISKNGIKSGNILNTFDSLTQRKYELYPYDKRAYVDLIEDPLNETVSLILQVKKNKMSNSSLNYGITSLRCLLTFNKYLRLKKVYLYKTGGREDLLFNDNFSCNETYPIQVWGETDADHKMNALEFAVTNKINAFISVINYPEYQLLITDVDGFKRGAETTVYKFVR